MPSSTGRRCRQAFLLVVTNRMMPVPQTALQTVIFSMGILNGVCPSMTGLSAASLRGQASVRTVRERARRAPVVERRFCLCEPDFPFLCSLVVQRVPKTTRPHCLSPSYRSNPNRRPRYMQGSSSPLKNNGYFIILEYFAEMPSNHDF